jgi:hemolysin III
LKEKSPEREPHYYTDSEERLNIGTHAFGLLLSVTGTAALIVKAVQLGDAWHSIGFSVFGFSLINLYAASTIYHRSQEKEKRLKWQIIDHASIYILIAGTYTPFTFFPLKGTIGWIIFGVVWGSAIVGVVLKMYFTGRYELLSTIMYILMGWIVIFAIKPLYNNLPVEGLIWLFGGGIAYTTGAILFSIPRIKYNHAIFHVFVLIGSFCHFMAVYFYV